MWPSATVSVVGWWRTQHKPEDGRVYLQPSVVDPDEPPATTLAMIADARRESGDLALVVFDAPGTAYSQHLAALDQLGQSVRHDHGIYVRVPDPRRLLDVLRPVLSDRLAHSRYGARSGDVADLVLRVRPRPRLRTRPRSARCGRWPASRIPTPTARSGSLLICFGALVFGRFGAIGLEQRADDVTLGRHRGLMEALFPKRESDVVGDL